MRYKLLAMDLDGTALGSDPDVFAQGVEEAAAQAAAKGCIIAAATGRPVGCLPAALTSKPSWLSWLVLCDGAEVVSARTGERLWRKAFSAAALEKIEAAARRLEIPVEYIDQDTRYYMLPSARDRLEKSGISSFHKGVLARHGCLLSGPAAALAERQILKINIPLIPQQSKPAFCAAVGDAALVMDCGPGGLEVTAPGAGKRAAVDCLAKFLGFTLADVMALGDSGNDAALLSAAGLGVAMGNAPAEVKTAAKAVTGCHTEGGAADAIRRWLLEE